MQIFQAHINDVSVDSGSVANRSVWSIGHGRTSVWTNTDYSFIVLAYWKTFQCRKLVQIDDLEINNIFIQTPLRLMTEIKHCLLCSTQ